MISLRFLQIQISKAVFQIRIYMLELPLSLFSRYIKN